MRVHSRLALFVAHVRGCTLSVCVLVAASHSLCAEWLEPRQVLSGKALFVTHSLNTWPSGVLSPFFGLFPTFCFCTGIKSIRKQRRQIGNPSKFQPFDWLAGCPLIHNLKLVGFVSLCVFPVVDHSSRFLLTEMPSCQSHGKRKSVCVQWAVSFCSYLLTAAQQN